MLSETYPDSSTPITVHPARLNALASLCDSEQQCYPLDIAPKYCDSRQAFRHPSSTNHHGALTPTRLVDPLRLETHRIFPEKEILHEADYNGGKGDWQQRQAQYGHHDA